MWEGRIAGTVPLIQLRAAHWLHPCAASLLVADDCAQVTLARHLQVRSRASLARQLLAACPQKHGRELARARHLDDQRARSHAHAP